MAEPKNKNFIFLGAPGAGKGTYSAKAVEAFGFVQISTGDILRENVKKGTDLGKEAQQYMEAGELVPDQLIIDLMRERLKEQDVRENGYILDGFPRTLKQAEALDDLLDELNLPLDKVVLLEVDKETIVERLSNRIVCPNCGRTYNTKTLKPNKENICDDCGTELIKRKDDNPETVANRYDTYMEKTAPLIEYYENKGILEKIDAVGPTEKIIAKLEQVVNA